MIDLLPARRRHDVAGSPALIAAPRWLEHRPMASPKPTVAAHSIGKSHAILVGPDELFEFCLRQLGAAVTHQRLTSGS